MPATLFVVVYSTGTNIIRRIVEAPDENDNSFVGTVQQNLAPGESAKVFNVNSFPQRTRAALQGQIGTPAHSGRCVVIDNTGLVVNIIHADPQIDRVQNMTIIQTDVAGIGWTWDGTTFTAPPIVVGP